MNTRLSPSPSCRTHLPHLLSLGALLISLLACSSLNPAGPERYYTTPEEDAKQKDRVTLKKIQATQADVNRIPGPQQYKEYVIALCDGYNSDMHLRQPEEMPMQQDVLALGDRIASKASYEAHSLYAYKGLYQLCTDNFLDGEQSLLQSIATKPGREAGEMLAVLYSASGEFNRVGEICAEIVPYLNAQDRFMMMETCKESLHATSDDSAFYWARGEDIAFWNAEQARREEAARRRAEAEERERAAIIEQQRREWQAQREQSKRNDICLAQCKQQAYLCNKDCYNESCTFNCNKVYEGCQEECYLRNN